MKNSKYYPWVVVALLWVVALLNYMDRQMLSTMKEAMSGSISELQSAEMFGNLMAAFMWIYGLASPFAGAIADRMNRKWLIVASLFVWSTVTLLMGYTHDFNTLYALRMVMGLSEAMYIPAALALIADFHTGKSRSLAVGVHMTGLYVGQALGGFGALLSQELSWEKTFIYFGLFGALYAVVLAFFLKETDEQIARIKSQNKNRKDTKEIVEQVFRNFQTIIKTVPFWGLFLFLSLDNFDRGGLRTYLSNLFENTLYNSLQLQILVITMIAIICYVVVLVGKSLSEQIQLILNPSDTQTETSNVVASFGKILTSVPFWGMLIFFTATSLPGWATKNWLPTLFEKNLNLEMTLAGPISTATIALSCFIGVFVGGFISDRWVKTNIRGRVYTSAMGLAMMAPALLLLGFGHSYVTVIGGGFLFGFGLGFFDTNNMPILCQFFSSRYRSTAYGVMNMSGVIAGGYITKALGKSTDAGSLGSDFAIMAAVVAVVVLIQLLILKPTTDNMTED